MPDPDVPVNPQGPPSPPQPASSVPPQPAESYKQELWLIALAVFLILGCCVFLILQGGGKTLSGQKTTGHSADDRSIASIQELGRLNSGSGIRPTNGDASCHLREGGLLEVTNKRGGEWRARYIPPPGDTLTGECESGTEFLIEESEFKQWTTPTIGKLLP